MSIEQKYNTLEPNNFDELIYWMTKLNVPHSYIDKFAEKFKYWDWKVLKEDVNDTPSFMFYFFRDDLQAEHIYYDVQGIIDGRLNSKIIDVHLGEYYENCGRNDYYDQNGNGKLTIFLEDNDIDSDSLIEELNAYVDTKEIKEYTLIKL
eukprot:82722_1